MSKKFAKEFQLLGKCVTDNVWLDSLRVGTSVQNQNFSPVTQNVACYQCIED